MYYFILEKKEKKKNLTKARKGPSERAETRRTVSPRERTRTKLKLFHRTEPSTEKEHYHYWEHEEVFLQSIYSYPNRTLILSFEIGSKKPRLAWNSRSSCLSLWRAGIITTDNHTQMCTSLYVGTAEKSGSVKCL
jgi:hypothetical protein